MKSVACGPDRERSDDGTVTATEEAQDRELTYTDISAAAPVN